MSHLEPQYGHDGGRGPAEHGEDGVSGRQPHERAGSETCANRKNYRAAKVMGQRYLTGCHSFCHKLLGWWLTCLDIELGCSTVLLEQLVQRVALSWIRGWHGKNYNSCIVWPRWKRLWLLNATLILKSTQSTIWANAPLCTPRMIEVVKLASYYVVNFNKLNLMK